MRRLWQHAVDIRIGSLVNRLDTRLSLLLEPSIPPRASNPYATHIPVLVGLGTMFKVRKVLELGCGQYSTLTFLDQSAFPDVVTLDSFETDREWMDTVAAATGHDPRINLSFVDGPMATVVSRIQFGSYDLVLLDDSTDILSRAATIREVARHCAPSNIVVVHDYEQKAYRDAARSISRRFRMTAFNPNTGVAWQDRPLDKRRLRKLNHLLGRYASDTQPEDRGRWIQIINNHPI